MKHTVLLLGALFVVLICPSFLTAGEHQRDSWYIGFGIGAGFDEAWYVDGKKVTFEDWHGLSDGNVTAALNFKAGGTLSPKLLLGFDLTSIGESSTNGYTDRFCSIDNYFLMLTFFPWEEGFFSRVGGGVSDLQVEEDFGAYTIERSVDGYGFLIGMGYAFWLGKSFNLTLNVDHSRQYYNNSSGEPHRSKFTIVYLGFDWY